MAQAAGLRQSASGRIDMRAVQDTAREQASKIKERLDAGAEQTERLQDIAEKMRSAVQRGNIDEVKILTADFDTARRSFAQNTKDLAAAMMGLGEEFRSIGVTLVEAKNFEPQEQILIDDASARVARAERSLANANDAWFFKDSRIVTARQGLEAAKIGLKVDTELAETQRRMRLENMNLEQSMQQLQTITTQITEIATKRIDDITENLKAVEAGAIATGKDLETLAEEGEQLQKKLNRANNELSALHEELNGYKANSTEWTECDGRIRAKNRARDKVETEKNKTFALTQEAQRFIEMYKVQEESQRQLLSFHETWIAMLQEGSRQRSVLYKSHLGVIQAAGDQQAMSMTDAIAVETDERTTKDAAEHLQAIRGNIADRLERAPEDVRRLRAIKAADTKAQVAFEQRVNTLQDQFYKNWGTGVGYDDRATYRGQEPAQPAQPA